MAKNWTQFGIGFWIMISPWLLGFANVSLAKWSNVIFGLVLVLVNAWFIFGEPHQQHGESHSGGSIRKP